MQYLWNSHWNFFYLGIIRNSFSVHLNSQNVIVAIIFTFTRGTKFFKNIQINLGSSLPFSILIEYIDFLADLFNVDILLNLL